MDHDEKPLSRPTPDVQPDPPRAETASLGEPGFESTLDGSSGEFLGDLEEALPARRLGRYVLLDELGAGGHGRGWMQRQPAATFERRSRLGRQALAERIFTETWTHPAAREALSVVLPRFDRAAAAGDPGRVPATP